ncbi:MAG: DUF2516 family protein [Dermatophilaceae bacterium]
MLGSAQGTLVLLLGVAALAAEVFALVAAVRHRPDAYVAAGKRTKTFWVAILAVAVALGFIVVGNVLSIFGIAAFVAAAAFLADVRPALSRVTGRGGGQGPYGPW